MNDLSAIRLVNAIKKISAKKPSNNMLVGEITSVDPLKIDIGNNIILTKSFLYLGQMCRPHKVTIPHNHLIDAHLTNSAKGIKTTGISAGTPTNADQKITYNTESQDITENDDGTITREKETEEHKNVDIGGATLGMSINVSTSPVSTSEGAGTVTSTVDKSTFTVTDGGHQHLIPKFQTQDVHFPDTDYEESVTIEIYPKLHVGDKVLLFAMNEGQFYYVAERIEE